MISDSLQQYQKSLRSAQVEPIPKSSPELRPCDDSVGNLRHCNQQVTELKAEAMKAEYTSALEILHLLRQGQLLMVNSRRKNGLILYKQYHAEFAGPGAAVGSFFDLDCQQVLPVGDLSLVLPPSHEERQKAYLIRRQWIRLTQQFTDNSVPIKRAQMILNQFEVYFDQSMISQVPDDAFAMLVGVLPHTIRMARRPPRKLNVKVKS